MEAETPHKDNQDNWSEGTHAKPGTEWPLSGQPGMGGK